MKATVTIARILLRASMLVLLVLGVLFWTGHALSLVPLHMALGLVLVLTLWTLSGLAVRRGGPAGLGIAAALLGLAVMLLGMTQTRLLPGNAHWVVQVGHLLLGIAAVGMGERLAKGLANWPGRAAATA